VIVCPSCGEENPARFRLCGFCGTPLVAELPAHEVRKTVTIVFSDLKGSTSLGEALDSESLREVLMRYFDEMRAVLEEHGGTVEKYIGDAVMAVFGLPTLHEDDALRAVRAAAGMQQALAQLNDELERVWGVRLTNRTGVNTGVVVAGDPLAGQHLVTGDAVNVAARLEQAAPALEILLGEPTYRLVRDHVDVEEVAPLELKGKSERVPAFRLRSVKQPAGSGLVSAVPIVGRDAELDRLLAELGAAVEDRSCRVVAVLGDAGVGKTRLLEELQSRVGAEVRTLRGRCLSYGRGITFWPVLEMTKQAAGILEDDSPEVATERLRALVGGDEEITARVASAVGLSGAPFSLDDLFWGVRKLIEHLAAERPVVVVVEDVHWAEASFLDLVDHLASAVDDRGVLVVCAARPELDELRPEWLKRGVERIELQPLPASASAGLVADLLGGAPLDTAVQERLADVGAGNPLFVRQLLSMLIEQGRVRRDNGSWVADGDLSELELPPTIHALLAARLDLLTREEQALLEPASVVGGVFPRAALLELVPEVLRGRVDELLGSLVRKHLLTRDPAQPRDDETYAFQHILIRDEAYDGLLKRTRATLHEQFADWAERVNRDRDRAMEYEEIFGYHLEQAYRYLAELGPVDDHGRELGERASTSLGSAGRRAFGRNDMAAAANLLRRAAELLPERHERRLRMLPDLGEALTEIGELAWAELFLTQAAEAAVELRDERLAAEAKLVLLLQRRYAERLDRWTATLLEEAEVAVEVFERVGDHAALARAWRLIMNAHGVAHRFGDAASAAERAGEHARLARDVRQESRAASGYAMAALHGPTPVPEAIERCNRVLAESSGDKRLEGLVLCLLGPLRAMQGDFDAARELYVKGRALLEDIGGTLIAASTTFNASTIEMLAGDVHEAERKLRRELELLERMGENYLRPTVAAYLAAAVWAQGRYDEAGEFTRLAEEIATDDDVITQALWRSVRARLLAHDEHFDEAIALADEAVELLGATDGLAKRGDALLALGEVLDRAGRHPEARRAVLDAIGLYERKGNAVAADAARSALARLGAASPTAAATS
jgi:class 3 adenylate cyclase/tetratricopeptide (TPR) repeat protein